VSKGSPRIAIAHPAFLWGGAEAVSVWGVQALREYDVTLVTLLPINWKAIDEFYGTSLRNQSVAVKALYNENAVTRRLYSNLSLFSLRQQLLSREVRRTNDRFDLIISTFNEMDLGTPGIQYVHAPFFGAYSAHARKTLGYPDSFTRKLFTRASATFCGASEKRLRDNVSITNSKWTASLLKDVCNVDAKVLYPPVSAQQSTEVWSRRENGFLCVGRFVRDKRLELSISIIDRVRALGADVSLKIVGHAHDKDYFDELERLRRARSSWLSFEQDISRSEMTNLFHHYKFCLHPRKAEQFGIGVAEMAASGCIPFVPSVGGQAEIVDFDSRLTFDEVEEAATKIVRLINNAEMQDDIRKHICAFKHRFSADRFMTEFRRIVEVTLSERAASRPLAFLSR
jgi:glycosyltransferase involved in cell wall biosynthesis